MSSTNMSFEHERLCEQGHIFRTRDTMPPSRTSWHGRRAAPHISAPLTNMFVLGRHVRARHILVLETNKAKVLPTNQTNIIYMTMILLLYKTIKQQNNTTIKQ